PTVSPCCAQYSSQPCCISEPIPDTNPVIGARTPTVKVSSVPEVDPVLTPEPDGADPLETDCEGALELDCADPPTSESAEPLEPDWLDDGDELPGAAHAATTPIASIVIPIRATGATRVFLLFKTGSFLELLSSFFSRPDAPG